MRFLAVGFAIFLGLCGVGNSAPIHLSWSETAYEDSLFIDEDEVVYCHILTDVTPVEFVGYGFEFIYGQGIEVVEFVPTLDSSISGITPVEEINPLALNDIYINYAECPSVSGVTCIGSLKISVSFSEIESNGGSTGLAILAINYIPFFLVNVYPNDCGMLSAYIEAGSWNTIGIFCRTSPVAKTSWGAVKTLFR